MTAPLKLTIEDAVAVKPLDWRTFAALMKRRREQRRVAMIVVGLVALAATLALLFALGLLGSAPWGGDEEKPAERMTLPRTVRETAPIYNTAVMPIAPEQASAINAERPVDVAKVIPARALMIARESAAGAGYGAALRCLTQAVYYEAASEPDLGQRAVAQVVLNRVRHPAFPNTVCGVVYQGSERRTGCQFSFTCDGSLARIPSLGGWARAERVARDALAGKVAAMVGNATHYHANYVVPYWAPTLDKAATVGAHIFYLMRGFLGSPRAFTSRYDVAAETPRADALAAAEEAVAEAIAAPNALAPADTALAPDPNAPREDLRAGRLIPGSGAAPGFEWTKPSSLRADEGRGELKAPTSGGLRIDEATKPPAPAEPEAAKPVGP